MAKKSGFLLVVGALVVLAGAFAFLLPAIIPLWLSTGSLEDAAYAAAGNLWAWIFSAAVWAGGAIVVLRWEQISTLAGALMRAAGAVVTTTEDTSMQRQPTFGFNPVSGLLWFIVQAGVVDAEKALTLLGTLGVGPVDEKTVNARISKYARMASSEEAIDVLNKAAVDAVLKLPEAARVRVRLWVSEVYPTLEDKLPREAFHGILRLLHCLDESLTSGEHGHPSAALASSTPIARKAEAVPQGRTKKSRLRTHGVDRGGVHPPMTRDPMPDVPRIERDATTRTELPLGFTPIRGILFFFDNCVWIEADALLALLKSFGLQISRATFLRESAWVTAAVAQVQSQDEYGRFVAASHLAILELPGAVRTRLRDYVVAAMPTFADKAIMTAGLLVLQLDEATSDGEHEPSQAQLPFDFTPLRGAVWFLFLFSGSANTKEMLPYFAGEAPEDIRAVRDALNWVVGEMKRAIETNKQEQFTMAAADAARALPPDLRTRLCRWAASVIPSMEGDLRVGYLALLQEALGESLPAEKHDDLKDEPSSSVPVLQRPEAVRRRRRNAASLPDDALPARLREALGKEYELAEVLGHGGFGVVFKARQVTLDRPVAIKVILPKWADDGRRRKMFEDEARMVGRLDEHPNIVPILQLGTRKLCWFSMRFVDGQDLGEYAKGIGPFSIGHLLKVLAPVASALDFAHAHGIVHRDVKPQNVMIDKYGFVLVSDFGLAMALEEPGLITPHQDNAGSLPYMSPEAFTGLARGGAVDQYALGVMAFYLLTGGEYPIVGDSPSSLAFNIVQAAPRAVLEPRPDLEPRLSTTIARALAKHPTDRFATCVAFVEALREAAGVAHETGGGTAASAQDAGDALPILPRAVRSEGVVAIGAPDVTLPQVRRPRRIKPAAPYRAEQGAIPPAQQWWLEHLGSLSDPRVERGAEATEGSRTGRHQRMWQEATDWLAQLTKAVLDQPGERWINSPNRYQAGNLAYYYMGRLYPETNPELGDIFHIGVQVSKRLEFVHKCDPALEAMASGPLITLWASANRNRIEREGRDELHALNQGLQHEILADRPELWREGGALVRARVGKHDTLMLPATYLDRVARGELEPRCSLFGPLISAQEVARDPDEAARRIAGFLTLLASPVREVRAAVAKL